jgi:hypothetical protein
MGAVSLYEGADQRNAVLAADSAIRVAMACVDCIVSARRLKLSRGRRKAPRVASFESRSFRIALGRLGIEEEPAADPVTDMHAR